MLAILTSSDDGKVILHMPYDATIVARLKMVIPSTYRTSGRVPESLDGRVRVCRYAQNAAAQCRRHRRR